MREQFIQNGHTTEQEVRAAIPVGTSQLDRAIAQAPDLESMGKRILNPEERKDKGAIEYTTPAEAMHNWAQDPHGEKTFAFIGQAYGIQPENVKPTLEKAGFGEYIKAKDEGRMVGMIATQVLKPTDYFMTNAFALKKLHDQGIPTALMVVEWPRDIFYKENADKRGGFGKLEFPVGTRRKKDKEGNLTDEIEITTVDIELRPTGIRHDDGYIQRISNINDANGVRCDQILIEVIDARSPHNKPYTEVLQKERTVLPNNKVIIKEQVRTHAKAALGFDIPNLVDTRITVDGQEVYEAFNRDAISMTDFYRTLWEQTIRTLRESGELPAEEDMPMFFVDAQHAYTTLAAEANTPDSVTQTIGIHTPDAIMRKILQLSDSEIEEITANPNFDFDTFLASHDFKITNGLLTHENGMMDPGSYYVAHTALPDIYFECSSCGGDKFVGKLQRAQEVRRSLGLHEKEVRIPDAEVEELEQYTIHPTGNYVDTSPNVDPETIQLNEEMKKVHNRQKKHIMIKKDAQPVIKEIVDRLKERQREIEQAYEERIRDPKPEDIITTTLFIPEPAASTYKVLFAGIEDAATEPEVRATINKVKKSPNHV